MTLTVVMICSYPLIKNAHERMLFFLMICHASEPRSVLCTLMQTFRWECHGNQTL